MNKYLDLTEILKDCPKGTKLYSPIFGDVYLDKIRPYLAVVVTTTKEQNSFKEEFLYDGRYGISGECMLFPSKDQRDWSKWHRPFVDGDIVTDIEGAVIIYQGITTCGYCGSFASLDHRNQFIPHYKAYLDYIRLSTEEEKQKLFDVIKDKGYRWNDENKTLEKLIVPKFKVGDTIRSKNGLQIYKISNVTSKYYTIRTQGCTGIIPVKDQNDWILIPSKFDPKTLKPFDKVLVRDIGYNTRWHIQFFETMYEDKKKYPFVCLGGKIHSYCIPYAGNEHLLNTINEPSEFYRYWEN